MPAAAAQAREGARAGGAGARAQRAWGVRPGPVGPAPWRYRELARRALGRRVGTGQLFPGPSSRRERAKAPGLLTCRGAGVGGGAGASGRFAREVERVPHVAPSLQNPGAPSPSRPGTGPRRRSNFCARWRAPGLPGTGMGATRCAPGGHCSSGLVGMLFGAGRWPLGVCSPRTESAILPFPDSSPNLGGHGHSGACDQEHQTHNRGPTLWYP